MVILILGIVVGFFGLAKIGKNVDLLTMLPEDLREVEGLRIYRDHFINENELIVVITGEVASDVVAASESLAAHVRGAENLAINNARWRTTDEMGVEQLADLAAYVWLNAAPEAVAKLAGDLSEGASAEVFLSALDELGTTQDARDIALLQYDPAGFLAFPGGRDLLEGLGDQSGVFASEDGLLRLVYLSHSGGFEGAGELDQWMTSVRASLAEWGDANPELSQSVQLALTGEPAFQAETLSGMQGDLLISVLGTSVAVALLFFYMHRRFRPLLWLMVSLAIVLILTLGIAALTYGELSAVSAGFAAILIALVADYGVLTWQEARATGKVHRELLSEVGPSIFWAAATTAAVFIGLNLSSFPGIAQLGNLVGAGILVGALIIAFFYIPIVSRLTRLPPRSTLQTSEIGHRPKYIAWIVGAICITSVGTILTLGLPPLNESATAMRPKRSEALDSIEMVMSKIDRWGDQRIPLIVADLPQTDIHDRLREVDQVIDGLAENGVIESAFIPRSLWPNEIRQRQNLDLLKPALASRSRLIAELDQTGFGEDAATFLERVFGVWENALKTDDHNIPCLPDSLSGDWPLILGQLIDVSPDSKPVMMGQLIPIQMEELIAGRYQNLKGLRLPGVYATGWDSLQGGTWPLMIRDFKVVFLPMALVLWLMLALVYRKLTDVIATLSMMALSWLCLIGSMSALAAIQAGLPGFGWLPVIEWNFMNLAAIPLLMGTGLDYSIHITLSIRRNRGDLRAVWERTGRAVVLCGLSTAAGFGSLAFASNRGLSSLGAVCCLGILITTTLTLTLLPRMLLPKSK